jgi:glyoxylate/hydroxypyruvate reductase A
MAILVHVAPFPAEPWIKALEKVLPKEQFVVHEQVTDPDDVSCVIVAHPPAGFLAGFKKLRMIGTVTAGVDRLVADPDLPQGVPIVRGGDPEGDGQITENIILHVLRHHRQLPAYAAAQARAEWVRLDQKLARDRTVGFLGLGIIARPGAEAIREMGFRVAAWTRTPKDAYGIECFHGAEGFAPFLARSEIIVNLLPVTQATTNILDAEAFAMLPKGAAVINLGRGEHLVDADLMAALDSGHLSAATLDVYRVEPLPSEDPLWRHPGITVMPHCSRKILPDGIVPQLAHGIRLTAAGETPPNTVDLDAGY